MSPGRGRGGFQKKERLPAPKGPKPLPAAPLGCTLNFFLGLTPKRERGGLGSHRAGQRESGAGSPPVQEEGAAVRPLLGTPKAPVLREAQRPAQAETGGRHPQGAPQAAADETLRGIRPPGPSASAERFLGGGVRFRSGSPSPAPPAPPPALSPFPLPLSEHPRPDRPGTSSPSAAKGPQAG